MLPWLAALLLAGPAAAADRTPVQTGVPTWPQQARLQLGGMVVRCVASLEVDADGNVTTVRLDAGCPNVFSPAVSRAMEAWRFAPGPASTERVTTVFSDGANTAMSGEVTALTLVRRAAPTWPLVGDDGPTGAACDALVHLSDAGAPDEVEVSGCTEPFAKETRRVMKKWLWEAPGRPVVTPYRLMFGTPAEGLARDLPTRPPPPPLVPIRQVPPKPPIQARALGPGEVVTCRVGATLKPNGAPKDLEILECPGLLHEAVLEAVAKWRWGKSGDDQTVVRDASVIAVVQVQIP